MNNMLLNYLAWSSARAKAINICQRQYAFRWVESWEGWLPESPAGKQLAYRLNGIIPDLRIVTGNIFHDRAGRILQRIACGMKVDTAVEISTAEEDFDRFLAESERLPLESLSGERKKLLCHHLGKSLAQSSVTSERATLSHMLQRFFDLPELAVFTANPTCLYRQFIESEMGAPTNELGVPARLKTDAVFFENDSVVICDWKTGKPNSEHKEKGVVYDIFVRERLRLTPTDRIKVRFHYLRDTNTEEFQFSEEERQEARWRIGEDFALMQEKSSDPIFNIADPDSFPARTDYHCLRCSHREMCPHFAAAEAKGAFESFESKEIQ